MQEPVQIREERVGAAGQPVVPTAQPVVPAAPVAATTYAPATASAYSGTTSTMYPVGYRAMQIVWLVIGVVNVILAFDFVFRLLRANDAGFASFIYAVGGVLAAPFDPVFGITAFRGDHSVGIIRWSDLLAIVVYLVIGAFVSKAVRIAYAPRDTRPV